MRRRGIVKDDRCPMGTRGWRNRNNRCRSGQVSNVIDGRLQPGGCDPDHVIVVIIEARAVGRALCLVRREMTVQDRARMVLVTFVQMFRRKCQPDSDIRRKRYDCCNARPEHGGHYGSHLVSGQTCPVYIRQAYCSLTNN